MVSNWYKRAKHETKFDHYRLIREDWRDKTREAMERQGIFFDLENDDIVGKERVLTLGEFKDYNDEMQPCRFVIQGCQAGGDWQNPTFYYRVQVHGKYSPLSGNLDFLGYGTDNCFVYIPVDGNSNLKKVTKDSGKTKLVPTEDGNGEKYQKIDDKACLEDLKSFLMKLTKMKPKKDSGWEGKIELTFKDGKLA